MSFKKILDFFGGGIVDSVGNAIDSIITSDEERLQLKNELEKIKSQANQKAGELELQHEVQITNRWVSDNGGNFITRSVRPLSLVYLLIILTVLAFCDGNAWGFQVKEAYVSLFETLTVTAFIAFFGGKSIERVKNGVRDA